MSVNKVILVGNLGRDPELRRSASQVAVCSFSIATTDRRKDSSGQWNEQTEWHNIVTFGNVAENCSRYLKKGRQVFIEGKLQTRKWQDKEGRDRWSTEVIANNVQFLGNRGGENSDVAYAAPQTQYATADNLATNTAPANPEEVTFEDDDIPF